MQDLEILESLDLNKILEELRQRDKKSKDLIKLTKTLTVDLNSFKKFTKVKLKSCANLLQRKELQNWKPLKN